MTKVAGNSGGSTIKGRSSTISSARSTSQIRSRSTSTSKASKTSKTQQKSQFENFTPSGVAGVGVGLAGAANQSSNAKFNSRVHAARNFSSRASVAANAGKGILNAASIPSNTSQAVRDINKAVQTGNSQDINRAVQSTASAGTAVLNATVGGLDAAKTGHIYRSAYNAAKSTGASKQVARAAAHTAATHALNGSSRQVARHGASAAAKAATKTGTRSARRAIARATGNAAASAARGAARGTLAKGAGRFVPGANIAIAGLDAAQAVAIQRDPNASTGKKVAGWVTAGASAVAATNVPIVSQIGAGVSTISGFLRDLW